MNENKSVSQFRLCSPESDFMFTRLFVWQHITCCLKLIFCDLTLHLHAQQREDDIPILFFQHHRHEMLSGVWYVICGLLWLDLVICISIELFFASSHSTYSDVYTEVSFFISLHLFGEWAAGVKINVNFVLFFILHHISVCYSQRFMAVS